MNEGLIELSTPERRGMGWEYFELQEHIGIYN